MAESSAGLSHKDRGKALVIETTFEPRVGPETRAEEEEELVDFNIYADDIGLDNPRLARTMLKAIILSKDWEVTKSR